MTAPGGTTDGPCVPEVVGVERSLGIHGSISVPGSKSYTNRALLIAGLARGTSRISNALVGDDAWSMANGLRALGVDAVDQAAPGSPGAWSVAGNGGVLPAGPILVDADMAGTTLRFLIAVGVLGAGGITVTGRDPLLRRPVGPLLEALRQCGANVSGSGELGDCAPVAIGPRDRPLGGRVSVDSSRSSQFVSALLLAAPYFDDDVVVAHHGLGARGFVDLTVGLMERHGVSVETTDRGLRVIAGTGYEARDEQVPPDASAASHLFTLAVASGGEISVMDMRDAQSQPDFAVLGVFEEFGARVSSSSDGAITVAAPERLRPVDTDLRLMPDQLPNVAVLAALAPGVSRIRGVGITRFHESDRIAAVATELAKAGIGVEVDGDDITIRGGGSPQPATFWAYHDHRMAMALAALGAAIGDTHIRGADAVSKTYRAFWSDAAELGLDWSPG
ncbi:MAG: 3-phosphoshikimate 1-carboxyvinyltransferase [Acidimicrobiales bacterium]